MTAPTGPDPQLARQFARLAERARDAGNFEEARAYFRRAMTLNPEMQARCAYLISQISHFDARNADLRTLETLYSHSAPESDDRMLLAFALGKASDELGDFPTAFEYFEEGNRLAASRYPFSPSTLDITEISRIFDADFYKGAAGHEDARSGVVPILIAGLPRSGSTLVEQILASHSAVSAGGELGLLLKVVKGWTDRTGAGFPAAFAGVAADDLAEIGREYVAGLSRHAEGRSHVTDKGLGTYPFIGLIAAALPRLRIVHCSRDLRDQGLSCYQHYFGPQQSFSYDQRNIAKYLRSRELLMTHWKNVLPGFIHTLRYEALVADSERETRRLLEHCGLPFEEACLEFHKTRRTIRTFSLRQVRRPVYTSSVGRWKHYATQLTPLLETLGDVTGGV